MTQNYWLVGAMWGGSEDMLPSFLAGGYWYLGYTADQDAGQNSLRDQMKIGDRMAVKRKLGQGARDIEVRALDMSNMWMSKTVTNGSMSIEL